jgi:sigma-B regulation protein RsbU (phosphoserine phosphatase)
MDIQLSMLPRTFPAFPDREEFKMHASMEAAGEVGGDFYDFIFVDDDHLCLCVGDVCGKGVPASLFMAISKVLIRLGASADFLMDAVAYKRGVGKNVITLVKQLER